jgi:prevent-host-death family protein
MRIAPLADVKARLSAYLEECKMEGPIVITRNGKAVAVLLAPADDDDLETLLLSRSPRFQALLDKSRRSIRAGKGLAAGDFWKAVAHRHREQATRKQRPEVSRLGRPNQSAAADAGQKRRRG